MKKGRWKLQPKLLLGLVLMAAVLMAVLIPAIAELYRGRMEDYYTKLAFDQASIAAQIIDGDKIAGYYQTEQEDDYYRQISDYLLLVKQTVGLTYVYVVVPEAEEMCYIWDVGEPGEEGVCQLGDRDAYYGGGKELMHSAFAADAPRTILITRNETYGYLASAYVAILDSQGQPAALAGVDISMEMINQEIWQFTAVALLLTGLVLVLAVVAYYYYIRRILIRPLGALHGAVRGLVAGGGMERLDSFQVDIHTGDEVEELADAFRYMLRELDEYIHNLSRVTAEKERIGAELNVATQIQADMLPRIFPPFPDRREFDIYATMNPAREVGGDFYDFFLVDENHLAVVIADVSGKGVPAALFMVIAKTLIKNYAQSGLEPGAVFDTVNNQLCENNQAGMFVTAFLGVLEISTGRFTWVNAGHNPPLISQPGGGYDWLKGKQNFVMAGMPGFCYRQQELTLRPGDCLFLYTDGVTEAMDAAGALYSGERLLAFFNQQNGHGPLEERLEGLRADIAAFAGGAEQADDITMLLLRLNETTGGSDHGGNQGTGGSGASGAGGGLSE